MTRSIKASVSPTKRALAREAGEAAGDAVAGDGNESLMKRMAGRELLFQSCTSWSEDEADRLRAVRCSFER